MNGRFGFLLLLILGLLPSSAAGALVADAAPAPGYTIVDLSGLPGAPAYVTSFANCINDRGQVVGSATPSGGGTHVVLWDNGKISDLGMLPGAGRASMAFDINNLGEIVGQSDYFRP